MNTYKILLISHEMSFTGAPQMLFKVAKILKEEGCFVEAWTLREGDLQTLFEEIGIRVIYKTGFERNVILNEASFYDFIICNTVVTHEYVQLLKNHIPTIWYIHEADYMTKYIEEYPDVLEVLKTDVPKYVVSEYAQEYFWNNFGVESSVLHNAVEDSREFVRIESRDTSKVTFVFVGTLMREKGVDILLEAYNNMETELKSKSQVFLIGLRIESDQDYNKKLDVLIKKSKNVIYFGEIKDHFKVLQLIAKGDVAVISSLYESCSLVALESAMLAKPLIVSKNVGAKYIVTKESGWILETMNVETLQGVMEDIVRNPERLIQMGIVSRKNYERTSSYSVVKDRLIDIVQENFVEKKEYRKSCLEKEKRENEEWAKYIQEKVKVIFKELYAKIEDSTEMKNVVLYGAANALIDIYPIIQEEHRVHIVKWVDKKYEKCKNCYMQIEKPDSINDIEYDFILVLVRKERTYIEIVNELKQMGVNEEKILWLRWKGRIR